MTPEEYTIKPITYKERTFDFMCVEDDALTRDYFSKGILYEEPLLAYIENTYKDLDVFLDIGGFIGTHSRFVKSVVGAREVHVFEPNTLLAPCIAHNALEATYHACGLGKFDTSMGLECAYKNLGTTRTTRALDIGASDVPIRMLDHIPHLAGCIDLIKIDVEGDEEFVVEGGLGVIERDLPDLIVEHLTIYSLQNTFRLLRPLGYTLDVFLTPTWEMYLYNSPRQVKQV